MTSRSVPHRHWSDADLHDICRLYPDTPPRVLADSFKVSTEAIRLIATRHGAHRTADAERLMRSTSQRRYPFNERAFEQIENAATAYWFGLLWADGGVRAKNYSLKLELKLSDHELVEAFHEWMGGGPPLRHDRGNVSVTYTSPLLVADLAKHSLKPRKTYGADIPDIMPSLLSHFIRGVFDGDGCVKGRTRREACVRIAGTKAFIGWLQESMTDSIGLRGSIREHGGCWVWDLGGGRQVTRFRDFIYAGASIWLRRKRMKFPVVLFSRYRLAH